MLFQYLFGEDIFISYSRADGMNYAMALADQLTGLGFTCRVDIYETEPSVELPARLKRDLLRSYMLVVVGTEGAAASVAVDQEIQEFLTTGRTVILVGCGDSVTRARWASRLAGLPEHRDSRDAMANGQPSAAIVNVIRNSFKYRRRNQRIRTIFWATAAGVLILGLAGVVGLGTIAKQVRRAVAERDAAQRKAEEGKAALERNNTELSQVRANVIVQENKLRGASAALERTESDLRKRQAALDGQVQLNEALRLTAALQERSNAGNFQPPRDALDALEAAWNFQRHGRQSEAASVLIESVSLLPKLRHVMRHESGVISHAWTAGGMLATGGRDGRVRLWNAVKGIQLSEMTMPGPVWVMKSSPDGKYVLAITGPNKAQATAHLLEALTLKPISTTICANPTDRLAWAPRGDKVALTCGTTAHVWEIHTGQVVKVSIGEYISQLQPNESGDRLAVVVNVGEDMDYKLKLYSLPDGKLDQRTQSCGLGGSRHFALQPAGRRFASSCDFMSTSARNAEQCHVELCDLTSGQLIARLPVQQRAHVFFDSQGQLLASYEGSEMKTWNALDGRSVSVWTLRGAHRSGGVFSPDSRYIATVEGSWARLVEASIGEDVAMFPLGSKVTNVDVIEQGRYAVTTSADTGAIEVWELQSLRRRAGFGYGGVVLGFTFSPDGRQLLTAGLAARGSDQEIMRLWEWETGRMQEEWERGEKARVSEWSLKWKYVPKEQARSAAKEVLKGRAWPEEVRRANVHALSRDGSLIATSVADGVKVWDVRTAKELAHVRIYREPNVVGFSSDDKFVIASVGAQLQGWRWQLNELRRETCSVLDDNMRSSSWRALAGVANKWRAVCRE
ncbi:MAG TPA: TIR domain-containing protein [Candidatus Binatia bacterium]|nr:TIR domain-containing protein [Candidatus Binatia bacterium]